MNCPVCETTGGCVCPALVISLRAEVERLTDALERIARHECDQIPYPPSDIIAGNALGYLPGIGKIDRAIHPPEILIPPVKESLTVQPQTDGNHLQGKGLHDTGMAQINPTDAEIATVTAANLTEMPNVTADQHAAMIRGALSLRRRIDAALTIDAALSPAAQPTTPDRTASEVLGHLTTHENYVVRTTTSQPTLNELIEQARALPPMTPEQHRAQCISFAYGNIKLHNPDITREQVEAIADMWVARLVPEIREQLLERIADEDSEALMPGGFDGH